MPSMLVKGQDAQDVAAYVAQVAAMPGQDTGALAAAVAQKVNPTPAVGKTIFTGVGSCGSCHTLADAGTTGTVGPNLNTLKAACAAPASQQARGATLEKCIETAITDPYKYLPPGYNVGIMPDTFSKTLSPSQIQALVAYLASVSKYGASGRRRGRCKQWRRAVTAARVLGRARRPQESWTVVGRPGGPLPAERRSHSS